MTLGALAGLGEHRWAIRSGGCIIGKGAPAPPNPVTTAQAQTASNRETAITQAGLNAVNQVTPNGNLSYEQIGTWPDGTPRYQATQSLSAAGQQLQNTQQGTQQNVANVAREQSGRLSGLLNQNIDFGSLPAAGANPNYTQYGSGPSLNTQGGSTGGISTGYSSGGDVTGSIAGAGTIQRDLGTNDFSGDVRRVEDAMYSRLNPQIDRQRQDFETQLVNRGLRPGTTAYDQQRQQFEQGVNDQRTSVLLNAGQEQNRLQSLALNAGNFTNSAQAQQYGQNANNSAFANSAQAQRNAQNAQAAQFGNSAQAQLYGQQLGNNTFANQANQQMYANQMGATAANNGLLDQRFANANTTRTNALNEAVLQRQLPLNELLALSGQGQLQQPQFANTPQTSVGGVDVAGITQNAYANQMAGYNQQQQQLGGLFSAGASLIPLLSDRRAKTDIKRIGATDAGTPIYQFRYKTGGPIQIGYMAQDLLETQPHAVTTGPDGLYRVNYGEVA